MCKLYAGSAQVDISPEDSQFLAGYPVTDRYSTGINDRLLSSSLYIKQSHNQVLFIANDIIYVSKKNVQNICRRISEKTGIVADNIMVTATHTHSGPIVTERYFGNAESDAPQMDAAYVQFAEDRMVESGVKAYKNARPAQIGLGIADASGIGTNRSDPEGPRDLQTPVLLVRERNTGNYIACMLICSMHPTVLHEDSTLLSGDFPGLARIYLQQEVVGKDCPVLHHTGPAGNQSPRYVTRANTVEEAKRIGEILGKAVAKAASEIRFNDALDIHTKSISVSLQKRAIPSIEQAYKNVEQAIATFESLKKSGAAKQNVRTAECAVFGAEKLLSFAKAEKDGILDRVYDAVLPANIQIIKLGQWTFVGWPGEIFVEYSLKIKHLFKNTFVIAYANGTLNGYIVTEEAALEGGYEASNTVWSYHSGQKLVDETVRLLNEMGV